MKCEALLASVEKGSFSAAAKELGYTPSGITRMVDALEAEIGFPLLNRSKSGVSLTKEGERLLPAFREIARWSRHIGQVSSEIAGLETGEITVGTYYSVAAHWLPGIIKSFQEAHPNIRINMREAGNRQLVEWLNARTIDCAIFGKREFSGDWIPLYPNPQVAWIPANWPQANLNRLPVRELDGMPFIMPMPGNDTDIERLFAREGIRPDIRATVTDGYTAWSLVSAGLGASMNDALMAKDWIGNVKTLELDPPYSVDVGIAVPNLAHAAPATKKFVEHVRASFAWQAEKTPPA